ncbi:SH3 domain-containing protein [Halorhodospira halophila]|uniref:SH3b domain-containing protein n=1 Tax=Halorhodospira halophila (strain DSM 244 / SL1) TaxID=349124 RepID=A1WY90_HALHL|nr:SH3 domain-containing protein [Halorhodospira halophila]ABM62652.1 protein of unknown function DUF1058 [Halorhodospira halophila SL1]MBK1728332.1 SH3 domain-containing protein [Halorhodospira halophila]
MRRSQWHWLILPLGLVLASAASGEDLLFVQSEQGEVYAEASLDAEVVRRVPRGTELEQLASEGVWYRVRHDGEEGWVSRLVVATQPPMERDSILDGEAPDIDDSRRRSSEVASAAAARGLTPEQRERLSDRDMADYRALAELEEQAVDEDELRAFREALR